MGLRNRENQVCPWWRAYFFDNSLRKLFHNPKKMFYPYLEKGMIALDIGCGMGYFSIGMAKIVGDEGCIYSVDLQPQMLNTLKRRSKKLGLDHLIHLHQCDKNSINLNIKADFVLTFWMVHEVPNTSSLFEEIFEILRSGGKYFLVEPKMHVSDTKIEQVTKDATDIGFRKIAEPQIAFSKAFVYEK